MQYILFFLLSLLVVVLQTTILPELFGTFGLYDLIIPLAAFFSLYRPFHEGFPTVVLAALMMDMISGAPPGIYTTTYIWLFLVFRHLWRFIDVRHSPVFLVIVVLGVLFQQVIFWMAICAREGRILFSGGGLQVVFFQVLWAVVSAPLIFLLLHLVFRYTDRIFSGSVNENGQPD